MKISAKSRYALAALIQMGQLCESEEFVSLVNLSEKLGISKIYLEQVFSLLKRGGIVISTKGFGGGYQLSRSMHEISVYDILSSIEFSLFEKPAQTVAEKAPNIESVMQDDVFMALDAVIPGVLKEITLDSLVMRAAQHDDGGGMYYI
ncbi:MAG: Rrf2 family transcriptional regulator [Oscillospiraceae bacterium]|nr:Rrf2 family transcriptional regulator [Oscillospiraceae bacterium]MCL2278154.1 Rrf2 family transcriptional regulator [Oscillospiraceae bacterium]